MKKILAFLVCVFVTNYAVAITIKHKTSKATSNYINNEVTNAEGLSDAEIISTLRNDIATIDSDIVACEKQRKAWIAATVIGGVGVVGTGIVAINQAGKLSEKKDEFNSLKTQVMDAADAAKTAERELQELKK